MKKLIRLIFYGLIYLLLRVNNIIAMIVILILAVTSIVLGVMYLNNKSVNIYSVISSNKSKETLEKYYDTKALLHFEGLTLIILSLGFVFVFIGLCIANQILMLIGVIYLIITYAGFFIYSKNGKRFLKQKNLQTVRD